MTPQEAELLIRSEVAAATPVGKALLLLLEDSELQHYRQTQRSNDALMTATICGRGQGINQFSQRIAPVQETAQPGRFNPTAAGAPR